MKKVCFILAVSVILSFTSCKSGNSQNSYSSEKIEAVISAHEKTMIFIWSDWCGASQRMLEKNIKPHLENLDKNDVGIVLIHYGSTVTDSLLPDRLVLNNRSYGGFFDKINANSKMKRLLRNYRRFNGFPIPLLVDKNGNILNFSEDGGVYGYYEITEAAKPVN